MNSNDSKYRADIDGLRAIAVIAVVLFHAFPEVLPGGFVGVDVFFVISGYLINGIIEQSIRKGTFSLRTFYARRINRIFPALLVVIASFYLLGWLVLFADEFRSLGGHIVAASLFGSNFLLMWEIGYFDPDVTLKPLLHLWSLGVEEQFYIVWPLTMILAARWRCNTTLVITLIGALSFGLNLHLIRTDAIAAFYSPLTRAWELLLGALLTRITFVSAVLEVPTQKMGAATRSLLALAGCGFIIMACCIFRPDYFFPGWRALVPTLGTAFVIAAGPTAWLNRNVLANPALVGLGLISFPLYLWHWPFLSFGYILASGSPPLEARFNLVALSFILALATYRFVERPLRSRAISRSRIALLCLGLCCLGSVGFWTVREDGLRDRTQISLLKQGGKRFSYRHSCEAITKAPYRDDWCHPGNTDTAPDVVLLGDSFSNAYAPTLARLSEKHPFTFKQFARGQCAMLLGYGPRVCQELLDAVLNSLDRSKLHTVILALDWRAYVHGKDYTMMRSAALPDPAEAFEAALKATVDFWQSSGQRVVLFYSPPQGLDPRQCSRSYKNGAFDSTVCSQPLAQAITNDDGYRQALTNILTSTSDITYFDPFPYFCEQDTCTVMNGSDVLYEDFFKNPSKPKLSWSHLSEAGAVLLADKGEHELVARVLKPMKIPSRKLSTAQ